MHDVIVGNPPWQHDTEQAERLRAIRREGWVSYDAGEQVLAHLGILFDSPESHRPECAALIGDANAGKTTLALRFTAEKQRALGGTAPVLFVECPPRADIGAFYTNAFRALKAPSPVTASSERKRIQFLDLMRRHGARMLIIDEIHNILVGSHESKMHFMVSLKSLSNELRIPIIAIGTRDALAAMHVDDQLSSRFPVMELPCWACSREYGVFVLSLIDAMGLRKKTEMNEALGRRIHLMSGGLTGGTVKLVTRLSEIAIVSGREQIDGWVLEQYGANRAPDD